MEQPPRPPEPDDDEDRRRFDARETYIHMSIRDGMMRAARERRQIDDHTAMLIATKYRWNRGTPIYIFAATGEVDSFGMHHELVDNYWKPESTDWNKLELTHLGIYVSAHPDQEAVPGWENPFLDE